MVKQKTLRLLMPEWQGGDYDLSVNTGELYPLGARLLAFLAPESGAETITVPLAAYDPKIKAVKENGVVHQAAVIRQMEEAYRILEERQPDRVVTFGGECLVSQAPFDYLNGRYQGNLGILWIDSHPDVSTPANHDREHAMVLGNLLGGGDPEMAKKVRHPFKSSQVVLVGMDKFDSPLELDNIRDFGLTVIKPDEVAKDSAKVAAWIRDRRIENLAVHLDLDVLNPQKFFSQLTNDPYSDESYPTVTGKLDLRQISRLLRDVAKVTRIVGLTISEYIPWDALHLQKMMQGLDIMK